MECRQYVYVDSYLSAMENSMLYMYPCVCLYVWGVYTKSDGLVCI